MRNKPANDSVPFDDPEDAEDARLAARRLKVKQASAAYLGRADLLELGLATCQELRQAQDGLREMQGKSPELTALVSTKSEEFAAIEEAMDEATRDKFWDVLGIRP